ncbi:uncharacterized protein LOC133529551 [Cydia pomonella]|uniref:uncharacterized protein LOC133529551 n=1 Tax=Cydia pomonella TaxID=82600 RepID=UPI002ADD5C5D|nr:uncharacterized protein LOC133529551 [Cydia pomonella]
MAYNGVIVLVIILTLVSYHSVTSEDCALAGKLNKNVHPPKEINARRNASPKTPKPDVLGPAIKYKFGITYPPGVRPYKGYKPDKSTVKTPPTNFFPMGSSVYTITVFPIPHLNIHKYSQGDRTCDWLLRSCMKVYHTGYVCAHALHGAKWTYNNYCAMEFTNCRLKSNIWQLAYFGSCVVSRMPDANEDFDIEGDNFLEAAVINEPPFNPLIGEQETLF